LMTGSIFSSLWEVESFNAQNCEELTKSGKKRHLFSVENTFRITKSRPSYFQEFLICCVVL